MLLSPTHSRADDLEVVLQASSDWIYHGTTESSGNPAAGIALDWQLSKRSFLGVEFHQAEVETRPQRHRSVLFYAGTGFEIGSNWYATAVISHREFPKSVKEWDFTEFRFQLDHRNGWGASIDFSPDYYEHDTAAVALELSYRRNITNRFYAYASIGALEIEESVWFTDYQYGKVGAGLRLGKVVVDLAYLANTEGESSSFGGAPLSEPQFVGQLTWRVR